MNEYELYQEYDVSRRHHVPDLNALAEQHSVVSDQIAAAEGLRKPIKKEDSDGGGAGNKGPRASKKVKGGLAAKVNAKIRAKVCHDSL